MKPIKPHAPPTATRMTETSGVQDLSDESIGGHINQFLAQWLCLQVRNRKWGARGPSGRLALAKLVIHVKYSIFIYLFIYF